MLSLSPFQLHSVLKTRLIFLSLACPVSRVQLCLNTQTNRNSDNESISLMNEVSPDSPLPLLWRTICKTSPALMFSLSFLFPFYHFSTFSCPLDETDNLKWPQPNLMSEASFVSFNSLGSFAPPLVLVRYWLILNIYFANLWLAQGSVGARVRASSKATPLIAKRGQIVCKLMRKLPYYSLELLP